MKLLLKKNNKIIILLIKYNKRMIINKKLFKIITLKMKKFMKELFLSLLIYVKILLKI